MRGEGGGVRGDGVKSGEGVKGEERGREAIVPVGSHWPGSASAARIWSLQSGPGIDFL